MNDPTSSLYKKDCISLIDSLCIKSEESAEAMNVDLVLGGVEVDDSKPITWKYYVNLAGNYHPADYEMYVLSADTQESILFSKENLIKHPATKARYFRNSNALEALIEAYPDQELLIIGILNPVDIEKAINAENFEIIGWDNSLLEPQEENIIPELQGFCDMFKLRWFVNDYKITDDLYVANQLGTLKLQLVPFLINARLANVKTRRAHSYHIWEYLGSEGKLDEFRNVVSLKQSMWLYRNIDWIYRNLGKNSTFEALKKNLFDDVGIRLFSYMIRQDHQYVNGDGTVIPTITRDSLNFHDNSSGLIPPTFEDLTNKLNVVIGNDSTWFNEDIEHSRKVTVAGETHSYQTKVIEALIEYPKPTQEISKADMQIRHWLHVAGDGRFKNYLYINERKNGTVLRVTPFEAYMLTQYLFGIWQGFPVLELPSFHAMKVVKAVKPTAESIMGLITPMGPTLKDVEDLLELIPEKQKFLSSSDYSNYIDELVRGLKRIKFIGDLQNSRYMKDGIDMVYHSLFDDYTYQLPITLLELIERLDVNFGNFRPSEARELMLSIITTATGMHVGTDGTVGEMHDAMINILRRLSSYNIQCVTNIDDAAPIAAKRPTMRISDITRNIDWKTTPFETGYRYEGVKTNCVSRCIIKNIKSEFINIRSDVVRRAPLSYFGYIPESPTTRRVVLNYSHIKYKVRKQ